MTNRQTVLNFPAGNKKGLNVYTDDYPLKSSSREGNGLKIVLSRNKKTNRLDVCQFLSFIVHSPHELASSYDNTKLCEFHFGYDLDVLITPEIIHADPSLAQFEPMERNCYFAGEKKLKFFKVYTRRNCQFECLADYLFKEPFMNCSRFFMVRDDSTTICGLERDMAAKYKTMFALVDIEDNVAGCDCLDECSSIKYNVEIISHSIADYNDTLDKLEVDTEVTLNFKFKDVDVVPLRRYQPLTFTEFLAQSGGMMGLFAGISALSVIEIFYFFSLRWMVNLWRWLTKQV